MALILTKAQQRQLRALYDAGAVTEGLHVGAHQLLSWMPNITQQLRNAGLVGLKVVRRRLETYTGLWLTDAGVQAAEELGNV